MTDKDETYEPSDFEAKTKGDNTTRPVKNETKEKATQRVGAYIKK